MLPAEKRKHTSLFDIFADYLRAPEASFDMQDIAREEIRHIHGSRAPRDAGGDQEDVLPWVSLQINN
jgi:hypothetical protein